MAKKREIRNSTAEFLTFVAEGKENGIQVLFLWILKIDWRVTGIFTSAGSYTLRM